MTEQLPEMPDNDSILDRFNGHMLEYYDPLDTLKRGVNKDELRRAFRDFPLGIRLAIERASTLHSPNGTRENSAFLMGALVSLKLVQFIEEVDGLDSQHDLASTIDDGGVVIRPPSIELGDGQSSGPLFLAPPDPEPRPEV